MLYRWHATDGKELSGLYFLGPGTPPAGVPVHEDHLAAMEHLALTLRVRSMEAVPVQEGEAGEVMDGPPGA